MSQLRVVLDTNVLMSALLFSGPPRRVLDLVVAGIVDCSLSVPILDELSDVLQRAKFGYSQQQVDMIVEELRDVCDVVRPAVRVDEIRADPSDNEILACAMEANADFIVSGDAHLLKLGRFKGMSIFSPLDLLARMAAGKQPPGRTPVRRRDGRR